MSDYDFSSLSGEEFEILSADLLTCHLGHRVERFKAGRDGGVDGRFSLPNGDEVIIQCKHWLKSGLASLMRAIEKTEAEKVRKLRPKRYIFVTSLPLSRTDKIKIKDLFSPYILCDSDVFGKEDLNDLLGKHSEVEKKHYKLWISSSNVLQTILNSATIGRSRHKIEEIFEESKWYVITQSHDQAIQMLEKTHSIIITGSPGVGKTTLADQLCLFYAKNNYEFCFIENSLNEAEAIYRKDSKQMFYFDDFLGSNVLKALTPHQDSQVINFIKRVEKDKNKRFILTSRTYILNQGKNLSELFELKKVNKTEHELSISSLTDMDKARILYNHIWFSDLSEDHTNEILKNKRYHEVIKHKKFNPRLISFITDSDRIPDESPNKYWEYIEKTLSNPEDIWRHSFEEGIDDVSRHIAIAVTLHGAPLPEKDFKELYKRIISSPLTSDVSKGYESVVRLLIGALLNRRILKEDQVLYDLFDPSIADFVISNYLDNFRYIDDLLICLKTPQSIYNLKSLMRSGKIDQNYYCKLLESQLLKLSKEQEKNEIDSYKLRLFSCAASFLIPPRGEVLDYIELMIKSALGCGPCSYSVDFFSFIYWSLTLGLINADDPSFKEQLHDWVLKCGQDNDEFIWISKIVFVVDVPISALTMQLKEQYIEYLSENITNDIFNDWIPNDLDDLYNHDFYDHSQLMEYVTDKLSDLSIYFDADDAYCIVECCDIDDIIQNNRASAKHEDYEDDVYKEDWHHRESSTDLIDNLFDNLKH